jgi:hypothetical protein
MGFHLLHTYQLGNEEAAQLYKCGIKTVIDHP